MHHFEVFFAPMPLVLEISTIHFSPPLRNAIRLKSNKFKDLLESGCCNNNSDTKD